MPHSIINFFRRNFGFSRSEVLGLLVMIPITGFILFVPRIVKNHLSISKVDHSLDKQILEEWKAETLAFTSVDTISISPTDIQYFNPNTLTKKEWVELGFKQKVANNIIKYRRKGGQFRQKDDLLKIYGINKQLVKEYRKYMLMPSITKKKAIVSRPIQRYVSKPVLAFEKIDLNKADTSQFMSIRGIGPYWSKRIVKYRNDLGGFRSQNQLYELYGMDKSLADTILNHSKLEEAPLVQISINQSSIDSLVKHPYISYRTAKAIVKYRMQHGNYLSVDELQKIVSLSDSVYQKMSPYLKVSY
ncbi:MAG: helix-hairpin-helix domain-containing protein [Reichenbachiella sp.]